MPHFCADEKNPEGRIHIQELHVQAQHDGQAVHLALDAHLANTMR